MTPAKLVLTPLVVALAWFIHDSALGFQQLESENQIAELTDANFGAWRDWIRAKESELVWQDLPWVNSFHQGLQRAAAENKPLLLWAMNGHPMGCT